MKDISHDYGSFSDAFLLPYFSQKRPPCLHICYHYKLEIYWATMK